MASHTVRIAKITQSYQNHFFSMDNTDHVHLLVFINSYDFKPIMHHDFHLRQVEIQGLSIIRTTGEVVSHGS